eukprot:CAMPEP_0119261926 /NCGR_PEP_ID=MMETSP1329-20130426/1820_1 /TAXON_ID=114041 /ORGANISM="Genus nov. species nov., Strain RCC1024" /LENGTH=109 /DNA_ID=CAMNT_0007261527 /DNA_START=191 /DNA_END=517 /DNA_ORIENTATION=+
MSARIPEIEDRERTGGPDRERIFGVIDSLKYFDDGESGFGFIRRHKSEAANGREFHVHFRHRAAPEPFSALKLHMEVEFTLLDYNGRPNAADVVPTGNILEPLKTKKAP